MLAIESRQGFPLGVVAGAEFDSVEVTLSRGDCLVLYTDGITQAKSPEDELFGEARLEMVVAGHRGSAEALADTILSDVRDFADVRPQSDDQSLMVLAKN